MPSEDVHVSAIPKTKLTPAEYLARERKAEFKSEYYRGETFAMAGASRFHNKVKENLIVELGIRFKGGPCQTFSSDQRVLVPATGLYTYPDIVIICGKPEYDAADRDTLVNPDAVIEVLSPSTENYDRGVKFRQYQQLPSVQEYILVSQTEPLVERYVRGSNGDWAYTAIPGLGGELALATVPARIPLAEIYNGVEFSDQSAAGETR
jgi:Uma2 family endonuclease